MVLFAGFQQNRCLHDLQLHHLVSIPKMTVLKNPSSVSKLLSQGKRFRKVIHNDSHQHATLDNVVKKHIPMPTGNYDQIKGRR